MVLPTEIQSALMNNNVDARKLIIDKFQSLALTEHLQDMTPAQRTLALQGIKQLAAKLSRKK
jgi:hypothetical protein